MSLNNFSTDGETQTTKLAMERKEITGENSPAKEMEKAKEMFKGILNKRKLRLDVGIARTHSAPTSPAANISLLDFTWDEEEARSVKRLKEGETKDSDGEREDTDGTERLATKIRKLIKSMDKEIRVVAELARERNTKREIKEATQNLRSYMSQIMTQESQVLLQTLGKKARMGERSSFSDGTDKEADKTKRYQQTWRRGPSYSFIDVTMATKKTARKIGRWQVLPEESLSDHGFIIFEVGGEERRSLNPGNTRPAFNMALIVNSLRRDLGNLNETENTVKSVTEALSRAQESGTIKRRGQIQNFPYWWNVDIEETRTACIAARRLLYRKRTETEIEAEEIEGYEREYKRRKNELSKKIRHVKRARWREVMDALEDDIWGKGYQIVAKEARGVETPYDLPHDKKLQIAKELFPRVEDPRRQEERDSVIDMIPFTKEEVVAAAENIRKERCPGPDGIKPETVKEAVKNPEIFTKLYSGFAADGVFPEEWKMARLVLIWKGKMPMEAPSSQRPICLLDVLGKLARPASAPEGKAGRR